MKQKIATEFTRHKLGFDEDGNSVEVTSPADIDTEAAILADHAQISLRAAELALEWMRQRDEEETFRAAGDIFAKLVSEIVGSSSKISVSVVGMRFLATSFLLNRVGESLTSLAKRAKVSKQLLSHHAIHVADRLQFHGFSQKRTEARAVYSIAARERWAALTPEERKARRRGERGIIGDAHSVTGGEQI